MSTSSPTAIPVVGLTRGKIIGGPSPPMSSILFLFIYLLNSDCVTLSFGSSILSLIWISSLISSKVFASLADILPPVVVFVEANSLIESISNDFVAGSTVNSDNALIDDGTLRPPIVNPCGPIAPNSSKLESSVLLV